MKVLILGARGGIARNFAENLYLVRDGKLRTHTDLHIDNIYEYDTGMDSLLLEQYCHDSRVIIDFSAFESNRDTELGFIAINLLLRQNSVGTMIYLCREEDEVIYKERLRAIDKEAGVRVCLIALPEVFGKWGAGLGRSSVTELCKSLAREKELPIVEQGEVRNLLYVDDITEMLLNLMEEEIAEGQALRVIHPDGYKVQLGEVLDLLESFSQQQKRQLMPEIPSGSFANKLFSVFLSYLPNEQFCTPLELRLTEGGEQYRVMATKNTGQITINRYKPGATLGMHWHNTKWEQYTVISGRGLVRQRSVGSEEVREFIVSGEKIQAVQMIPGYIHSITNLSETEDLVILIWASEVFDPKHPDTNAAEI